MECSFCKMVRRNKRVIVHIDHQEIQQIAHFHNLGSIIQKDSGIEEEVIRRIKVWLVWRSTFEHICDRRNL